MMENISHDLNREIQLLKHFFLMYLPRKTFLKIDDVRKYLQLKNIIPLGDSHKSAERKNLKIILDLIKTENIDLFLGFHNPMMIDRHLREYLLNNFLDYINGENHKPIFEVKGEISIFDNTRNWSIDYPKYFSFDDIVILKSDLDKIYDAIPIIFTTKSNLIEQTLDKDKLIQKQRETIDRQAKEIADLKAQLEQQPNQPSDMAADEPLKGIAKVNYDKDKAKAFASIVAKFLWNIDTNQQLRIGEMATQLYPLIHEFNNNALPQGNDTIKDWIRPHAPKYASKAGNTPKSQPPIILTLKK